LIYKQQSLDIGVVIVFFRLCASVLIVLHPQSRFHIFALAIFFPWFLFLDYWILISSFMFFFSKLDVCRSEEEEKRKDLEEELRTR
jgi:hypothetical protein